MLYASGLALVVSGLGATRARQGSSSAELRQVLKQLEDRGRDFENFSARFTQKKYTAVLKEFDAPESGIFLYARAKDGSALLRQEVQSPSNRVLTIKGGVATVYQPKLRQAQVMNLGKNKDKAEYLAIGIGQSPAKLEQTFNMAYAGTEKVGNVVCSILTLKPKNPSAAAYFSSITLWVAKPSGVPIQQKLTEPNGDYLLVNFTQEKVNTKISAASFEAKLPQGTEIQKIG
jgi:outer membrane lipoprotein-sorting protein